MPVVGIPSILPLSSNDTSAVGGSTEITRLTTLFPFVSPICSPIMNFPPLSSRGVEWGSPGVCILLPEMPVEANFVFQDRIPSRPELYPHSPSAPSPNRVYPLRDQQAKAATLNSE